MPPPARSPGGVTVVVTVLHDERVRRTLESLRRQQRPPTAVLVDDGGGPATPVRSIAEEFARLDPRFRWLDAPGTIAESRNRALEAITTEFVAFLDADEEAPPQWLEELLAPFGEARVGFVGGPTPGRPDTLTTVGARYYDGYLRRLYETVGARRPHALPMGNSAWRMAVFDQVGALDETLFPGASSEDQELAVRAGRAGWLGLYAPRAFVWHDFSDLGTVALLRKQSRYALGGYVVWRRRGTTYEASGGRLAPYVVLPALALVGLALLAVPGLRLGAELLLGVGLGGLGLLAVALTVAGLREEARYPGLRYSALEIPRRWATLVGALRGWWRYGRSGHGRGRSAATPSGKG